jgi:radical SAM protein
MTTPFTQRPFIVIWETTRACGLACVHCRAEAIPRRDPDELTTEEGKRLIDRVAAFGSPPPILVLTGGDPLRRLDIATLVAHGTQLGVPVSLTPSGTAAVTQERLAALKEAGLARLAVSLDGATAEAHDAFRGVRGSHRHTMRIIERAQVLGLPLQINTTVCTHTRNDLPALARQMGEFGVVLWALFFLIPVGRAQADQGLGPNEIETVLHWAAQLSRHVPFGIKTTEAPHYHRVLAERSRSRLDPPPVGECGGRVAAPASKIARAGRAVTDGNGFVFIDHVGNICPSGFLPIPAGNVRRDDLMTVYREDPLFLALRDPARLGGRCGRCEYREQCGGSRARAWALSGDLLGEDPGCSYQPAATALQPGSMISGGSDSAPVVTEEQVREALGTVSDPELGMSVVELGLVYGLEIRNGAVTVTMTLTTPGCPIHDSMSDWAREAVMRVPGVEHVEIRITFDPPWTPDRIQLGSDSRRLLRGGSQ